MFCCYLSLFQCFGLCSNNRLRKLNSSSFEIFRIQLDTNDQFVFWSGLTMAFPSYPHGWQISRLWNQTWSNACCESTFDSDFHTSFRIIPLSTFNLYRYQDSIAEDFIGRITNRIILCYFRIRWVYRTSNILLQLLYSILISNWLKIFHVRRHLMPTYRYLQKDR